MTINFHARHRLRQRRDQAAVIRTKKADKILKELDAALARHVRPRTRRKLRAVKMVLLGANTAQAAMAIKADESSVKKWLRMVRESGCGALADFKPKKKPAKNSAELRSLRKAIGLALRADLGRSARMRLLAVDAVLNGKAASQVAAEVGVAANSVWSWVARVKRSGVQAFMLSPLVEQVTIGMDGDELRRLARADRNYLARRRLLTLALLADGLSVREASRKMNSRPETVRRWIERFRSGGADALRSHQPLGRPKRPKPA